MADPTTCVLCGDECHQPGRFCTNCVGDSRRPVAARGGPREVSSGPPEVRVGPARVGPLRILQWPISVALLVTTALAGMRAGAALAQLSDDLRDRRLGRGAVDAGAIRHLAGVDQRLVVVGAAVALVVAALWLLWWAFAFANLRPLGVAPREGESWAVLSWAVPLAHLVVPQRVADELWKGSDPWAPLGWRPPRHGRRSALVRTWWMSWWGAVALLVATEIGAAGLDGRPALLNPPPGTWPAAALAGALAASAVLTAVAGLAAICLVTGVTARQRERARMMVDIGLV